MYSKTFETEITGTHAPEKSNHCRVSVRDKLK